MNSAFELSMISLLVGGMVVLAMLVKAAFERIQIPALVGYVALGFALGSVDSRYSLLTPTAEDVFEFLGTLGVFALLFHIGLESKLRQLIRQLRHALLIGAIGILISAAAGFAASYYLLSLGFVTSLIIAIALTATSVGIPSGVWQETGAVKSPPGQLFLDVAEFDDICGVVLMALLFALLPVLENSRATGSHPSVLMTVGVFALKLLGFGLFCVLFSRYAERPITRFFEKLEKPPDPMLMVAGTGIVIASLAGLLGFSVAIGAFFAGLVFSRDPEAVKMNTSFNSLYDLFSPFFFISIGLQIQPTALAPALLPAAVLLVAAVLGKFIGSAAPATLAQPWSTAVVLGASMVPRAEISMIVMQHGSRSGEGIVPDHLFSAMILVSAITCGLGAIILHRLISLRITNQQGNR